MVPHQLRDLGEDDGIPMENRLGVSAKCSRSCSGSASAPVVPAGSSGHPATGLLAAGGGGSPRQPRPGGARPRRSPSEPLRTRPPPGHARPCRPDRVPPGRGRCAVGARGAPVLRTHRLACGRKRPSTGGERTCGSTANLAASTRASTGCGMSMSSRFSCSGTCTCAFLCKTQSRKLRIRDVDNKTAPTTSQNFFRGTAR
mmetsp:Transcript_52325/g.147312  ORF Transcript_52325/g.147312 Transcript_52325/m.147312 type:complete len:200 (-) Transcript_52325:3758-4357(-)